MKTNLQHTCHGNSAQGGKHIGNVSTVKGVRERTNLTQRQKNERNKGLEQRIENRQQK